MKRDTPCGPIQGTPARAPGVTAYKGIRYATAGRWEYPAPVTHWEGVYEAVRYGPNALQESAFVPEGQNGRPSFYYHEFREGLPYTYSEDCLFLNIWAPDKAQKAPVIVYIHGGAFLNGAGWDKVFDEPVWPRHGVVAVTLNYRLGPLGYACLPELAAEAGRTGNYGLYDQLCALQWVHDNIAAFGGDPGNVTLMGQSALAIPYMAGGNSQDMRPELAADALAWCQKQPVPSYAWYFTRPLPSDEKGAWHSADLWYWFGTLNHCWRPFTEEDRRLSSQMVRYLVNFARTGDPNGADLPTWAPAAPGSRAVLGLDLPDPAMAPLPESPQTGVFGW